MTRAPSSARTVQWAPPCVLRLEERLGWGHPAEGCGVPGPRCRGLCREHAQQAGPCRAPARGVAAVPVLGAGVAGGPGSAGPEEGCPLRSEAAAGLPICVGRGQSLPMSGPGRLPSLPAARAARGGRDELELIRPSLYRNVARQLNVSPHSETAVTSAFLAVAAQIFSAALRLPVAEPPCCPVVTPSRGAGQGRPRLWRRRHVGQSGVPVLGGRGAGRRLCAAGPARRGARSRRLPRGVRAQDAGELAAEAWRMGISILRNYTLCSPKDRSHNVCSSNIHNSSKLDTTQMPKCPSQEDTRTGCEPWGTRHSSSVTEQKLLDTRVDRN
ncbi:bcl-2-related ovarian killer protein isoform X4 [Pteropus medius]|uniref:bcl-2-related ovarian killer protein isoform X4 n=1 Tax=Pteropus vampyrus TaxID=132908 RepID=UPI00196AF5DB|nr:bcl-2-related ovarian killer protein isoform X4 [Pteropus giganteus]